MNCLLKVFVASQLLWMTIFAQDDFTEIHKEDFARWSAETSLSQIDIHRMWKSTSHYASERDDDSSIELLDVKSLGARKQILMIISAGLPRCITVAVFSAAPSYQKLWQENQGPDNNGFCDNLGVAASVNTKPDGIIEVTTALNRNEEEGSHAVTRTYSYKWDGKSYSWLATRDSSKVVRSRR